MRASEFVKINEGIGDTLRTVGSNIGSGITNWAAKQGLMGRTAAISAHAAQIGKDKQAVGDQIRKENYNKFIKEMPIAIQRGINSGTVSAPGATGGMSIAEFVKQYTQALFSNYRLPPASETALNNAISNFETAFSAQYDPKSTVLKGAAVAAAEKIWDVYETASKLMPGGSGSTKRYPPPTTDETVSTEKGQYQFDVAQKKWFKTHNNNGSATTPNWVAVPTPPGPIEVKDQVNIDALNTKAASV